MAATRNWSIDDVKEMVKLFEESNDWHKVADHFNTTRVTIRQAVKRHYPNYSIDPIHDLTGFKRIPDFQGYWVSKDCQVYNIKRRRFLKPGYDQMGYLRVNLLKGNKIKTVRLHTILAKTFIPNPNNHRYVRHLNDNRKDNRLENLAWGTARHNIADALRNHGMGRKLSAEQVLEIFYSKKPTLWLAKEHDINSEVIWSIKKKRKYKEITQGLIAVESLHEADYLKL